MGRGQAAGGGGTGALAALAGGSEAVHQAQPGVRAASVVDLAGTLVLRAVLLHGRHAVHLVAAEGRCLDGLLPSAQAVHALQFLAASSGLDICMGDQLVKPLTWTSPSSRTDRA